MNPLIIEFSPSFSCFLPLKSKFSPQNCVIKVPESVLFFRMRRSFTFTQTNRIINNFVHLSILTPASIFQSCCESVRITISLPKLKKMNKQTLWVIMSEDG
jgi:hypothetical protein